MSKTVEVKMRLNTETEEVEVLIDEEVLASSGKELFVNWVGWYNEKHKPVEPEVKVEETTDEPVVDKPEEPVVD